MQKKIALLYDFDCTLTKGFMFEYGLMQSLGYDNIDKFFSDVNLASGADNDTDMCLSMMGGVLSLVKGNGMRLTRDYLHSNGKNMEYYPGVAEWFEKINAIGASLGYEIEHFVISSGLKEIVEGSSIARYFKRIYANFYLYKDGEAFWPSQVVNYTNKTQYIFRVRKNALDDLGDLKNINRKMSEDEMVPFKNIIYLGDSQTDIPSFKVVKNSGGLSICVYDETSEKARLTAEKCLIEGRVNYFTTADYREGSSLYTLIKNYIENIAKTNNE